MNTNLLQPFPLRPDPDWQRRADNTYYDNKTGLPALHHPPQAYAAGFEAGALAAAQQLAYALEHDKLAFARLLGQYKSGNAHPVKGWQHEPPRN
jgi:hypothetical protein